jgi:hypothetical protein
MVGFKTPYVSGVFLLFHGSDSTLATFYALNRSLVGAIDPCVGQIMADLITRVLVFSAGKTPGSF